MMGLGTEELVLVAHCVAFPRPLSQVEPAFHYLPGLLGKTIELCGETTL